MAIAGYRRLTAVGVLLVLFCAGVFYGAGASGVRARAAAGGYYDGYITEYNRDHALSKRFAGEIAALVLPVAAAAVPETTAVRAEIFVRKGRYPAQASYAPGMAEPVCLHVSFRGAAVSEAEFVDRCVTVREAVRARGLPVQHLRFDYRWCVSGEGFGLDMEGDALTADRRSLLAGGKVYRVHRYTPERPRGKQ